MPHVAFATSALLLFAEGGQFYRICTVCSPQLDRYGIGLGLTLAVKESAFVLWAIYAALPEKRLAQQKIVLHTFGYGRMQALNWLVLPAIAPALGAVMLAVLAWSLSVVDVAIVLGPGNPPTLAVLAWQWLAQGDAQQQTKGTLLCLVLLLLLAALAAWDTASGRHGGAPSVTPPEFVTLRILRCPHGRWAGYCRCAAYSVRWFC